MAQLCYYTSDALEQLRNTIENHLDWYYMPEGLPPSVPSGGVRESQLTAPSPEYALEIDKKHPSKTDAVNAVTLYTQLSALTRHQASIEGMWAYLCHQTFSKYVATRWLNRRPENREEAVRSVRNHFFAVGNRALIRDNGISRLWWLGKTANDVDPDNPQQFLEILLHRQDVRSALIERPSVSMNQGVLRGIYDVMREHWANGGELFKREIFRNWMIALNRRGGVILLDALPKATLGQLLREEAENALRN